MDVSKRMIGLQVVRSLAQPVAVASAAAVSTAGANGPVRVHQA
jgi:hypothetical protein